MVKYPNISRPPHILPQRDNQERYPKFLSRIRAAVGTYRDLLILFDMEDQHYDGLDTALLEGLIRAQELAAEKQVKSRNRPKQEIKVPDRLITR